MKLCKDCHPRATCCDFCIHFDFNADENGSYTDDGYCRLHKKPSDPDDGCDDFHCEHVKEKNKRKNIKK